MKIAILTINNKQNGYEHISAFSTPNKQMYASIHSYSLISITENLSSNSSMIGWEKIRLLKELINKKEYDWIFWLGCDAIITNMFQKIESIIDENYHFILTTDSHGINSDSMLVKCSEKSLELLNEMTLPKPEYINHPEFEQGVMGELFKGKYIDLVKYVPQKTMNSYLYDNYIHMPEYAEKKDKFGNIGEWSEGDFVIHFPGITNYKKLRNCIIFSEKARSFYNKTCTLQALKHYNMDEQE